MRPIQTVQDRPAESTSLAIAVAALIARIFGWADDKETLTYLVVLVGAVPAIVTWIVVLVKGTQHGG